MKKKLSLMLAAFALTGVLFCSCSKDEDKDNKQTNTTNQDQASAETILLNSMNTVGQSLSQCDFKELDPLTIALSQPNKAAKGWGGKENNVDLNKVLEQLKAFLQSLNPATYNMDNPYTKSGSFTNMKETLSLAWTLSGYLTKSEGSRMFDGYNATIIYDSIVVKANDSTTYKIYGGGGTDRKFGLMNMTSNDARLVTINKNGKTILVATVASGVTAGISAAGLSFEATVSGTLSYMEHFFTFYYEPVSENVASAEISYYKDNQKMAEISSLIQNNNPGRFSTNFGINSTIDVMDGTALFEISINDVKTLIDQLKESVEMIDSTTSTATLEQCQELVNAFNDNMSISLSVMGSHVGNVTLGYAPVVGSEDNYYLVFMVSGPLFGDPMPITEVLDIFGIDIQSIIDGLAKGLPARRS